MISINVFSQMGHIVVIAGDYPAPGHMRLVFVQQLVEAMLNEGASISVVAPQSIVHALIHKESMLPRHMQFECDNKVHYDVFRPYFITMGNNKLLGKIAMFWNRLVLKKLLKQIKPNLIYSHFWSNALLVQPIVSAWKLPLFIACGEGDNALEDMITTIPEKQLKSLKSTVSGVISVSSENLRKCVKYNLVDSSQIEVFPNGVDIDLFTKHNRSLSRAKIGALEKDFIIAFVGGFIPRKGPERLAKAIALINDPEIKVLFIGKPFPGYPFDFDCPGILFKGPINHDELPWYLSAADIFVLPTQKEGCCNAIVEALSIGIPVISSNGAFNDDILNDNNSLRIDPNNIEQLMEAIIKLKNNDVLREQMCKYSKMHHSDYSIRERAKRILAFIESKLQS